MDRLTVAEREEIEVLSVALFGKTSTWQKLVKKGLEEPVLDSEGKPKFQGKTPLTRLVFKTEKEIFLILKDLKEKMDLAKKEANEKAALKRQEQEVQKIALEAAGQA